MSLKSLKLKDNVQFFTTNDGCRIAYQIDGNIEKPVLVFSNSIASNFSMWDYQIPEFTKHFRVIRFDTRGNGNSDAPAGDYSINRMSLDVIELLDHLNIDKVNFCGLSLGGMIGQYLGVHYPEKLDKLILANTSSFLGPINFWNESILDLRKNKDVTPYAPTFIKNWFPEEMITNRHKIVDDFYQVILTMTPHGLAGSYAAVRDMNFKNTLSLITTKTLIIAGENDKVTLPDHSRFMADAIPNAQLHIMPAVHLTNIELKEEFNRMVLSFLIK